MRNPFTRWLLVASLLVGASAAAQQPIPERLYVGPAVLVGSSRLTGLGGAYVGLAEGADGMASNYASLAQRAPDRDDGWDWDGTFSFLLGAAPSSRDLDNDGLRDSARSSQEILTGLMLQIGRVGFGVYWRRSAATFCVLDDCATYGEVEVVRGQSGLAAALALWKDQLIFGFGFLIGSAQLAMGSERRFYAGNAVEADALFRPLGKPFRIGVSVKPSTEGLLQEPGALLGGHGLYGAIVNPAVISLGGSVRLGEGNERFNRLSPDAREGMPQEEAGPLPPPPEGEDPPGRWLLTAQLDFVLPAENATSLAAFTRPQLVRERVGGQLAFAPRLGAEHETILRRWRNRLGFYLEPSPFPTGAPRPHVTGGAEVFLFKLVWKWAASGSFDLARDYYNFGLSIGFWH